jgi:hypothetical protein
MEPTSAFGKVGRTIGRPQQGGGFVMAIKHRATAIAIFALATLGACMSSRVASPPPSDVEPLAGRWMTWVLTSGMIRRPQIRADIGKRPVNTEANTDG